MTNSRQQFNHTDVLRLEIQNTGTGLVNLVANHDGALGGWGWVTPVANSYIRDAYGSGLLFVAGGGVPTFFYTEPMPVVAGQYAGARWDLVAITGLYRVKIEWLNSALTVLSSSTQTAYLNTVGTATLTAQLAPASTAFMRLRFDHYSNTSAGNPGAGWDVEFNNVVVAKAATAAALGVSRTNVVPNPSFETNTTGWTGLFGTTIARVVTTSPHGTALLRATAAGKFARFESGLISITGGIDYTLSTQTRGVTTTRPTNLVLTWYDAAGVVLRSSTSSSIGTGTFASLSLVSTAPANATQARITANVTANGPDITGEQFYFDAFQLESGFGVRPFIVGTLANQFLGVVDYGYTNIIGPTHEIKIVREGLNVGTLNATILDTSLDPSTADLIRPGRKCRLMVFSDGSGTWEPLYTGKINEADVTYDLKATDPNKVSRIFISAVDNTATLANTSRPDGVGTIAALPYVLEGAGVPWNVNGNGNQVSSAVVVSNNDNASALDQIAITRDSKSGYAWIDRNNVLQAWDPASINPDPGNLIPNNKFDVNTTGWTGANATLTRDTSQFVESGLPGDVASLRATATASATSVRAYTPAGVSGISVAGGRDYFVGGYVRANGTGRLIMIIVSWYDLEGTLVSTSNTPSVVSGPFWSEIGDYDVPFTAPPSARYAQVEMFVDATGVVAGNIFNFDFVSFYPFSPQFTERNYSDLDVSFSTSDCINEVVIKNIEWDPADATKSVDVVYGPYRDEPSIAEWGRYSSEFTTHGLTAGQVATLGASILTKNKTPAVRINSVQVPVVTTRDIRPTLALVDLYDEATASNNDLPLISYAFITGIEHTINNDGWLMDLTFSDSTGVATPQVTPPVQSSGANLDVTDLAIPSAGTGFSSGTTLTRRGNVCDLYFNATSTGATAAGTHTINIPAAHRPASNAARYVNMLDSASGGVAGVYLDGVNGTIRHVFARAAGAGTIGHITYVANGNG